MSCGHQCHQVGGPWIAENPDCPIHGYMAQREESRVESAKDDLRRQLCHAETVDDLRLIMSEMLELI